LKNTVRNGAKSTTCYLSSNVDIGSVEHCVSAKALTISITSATVSGTNCRKMQSLGTGVKSGGGALAVDALTLLTLSLKKLRNVVE